MLSKYVYTNISVSVRVYLDTVVLCFSFFFGLHCFAFLVSFSLLDYI